MQKELRLRKAKDFALVYRMGRSWADDLLVLKAMPRGNGGENRFGFSVSKRTGNAVARNTIKRRAREAIRHTPIKKGWDMVFIARKRAGMADYHQLETSARKLLSRADLLSTATGVERTSP